MKPITHARKALLLEYFEVLETQLRFALRDAAAAGTAASSPEFIDNLVDQVQQRLAQSPDAAGPSHQQIRKTLENVLDPQFTPEANGDPVKAVHILRNQLLEQAAYTPPPEGRWRPSKVAPRGAARRKPR